MKHPTKKKPPLHKAEDLRNDSLAISKYYLRVARESMQEAPSTPARQHRVSQHEKIFARPNLLHKRILGLPGSQLSALLWISDCFYVTRRIGKHRGNLACSPEHREKAERLTGSWLIL